MSRLRRYLVPALLLAAVIFVCGKLLMTPVWRRTVSWEQKQLQNLGGLYAVLEYGWPWAYAQRDAPFGSAAAYPKFWLGPLVADVLVLALIVAFFGSMLTLHWRRHRRWSRLSLRELLVMVAIVASACGWLMSHSRLRAREQQLIDLARIRLPEHKVPCQIIFSDNLPHGPTGKIDRKTLRENALSSTSADCADYPLHSGST